MKVKVDITMHVETDFDLIVEELKGRYFKFSRDGYLTYTSPLLEPKAASKLIFKFKPLVEGGRNLSVIFEGEVEGVKNLLNRAFDCYKTTPKMVRYDLIEPDYTIEGYEEIIAKETSWQEVNPRIYTTNGRFQANCLLMDNYVEFMTRRIKSIEDVCAFIQECSYLSDIFIPKVEFNLFSYEDIEQRLAM